MEVSGSERFIFKETVVGESHIFRMKFFDAKVICDEELRLACKSADLYLRRSFEVVS
jgi:hypothetical protein